MKPTLLWAALYIALSTPAAAQQYFYPDPSFNTDGYVIPSYPGHDRGYDLVRQNDGKILTVGTGSAGCIVARFLTDGSPDATFGTGGLVTFQFGAGNNILKAIALQSDGKIVVAGGFSTKIGVARLMSNGALDPTFGTAGKAIANIDNNTAATALVIDGNGKIIVTAQAQAAGSSDYKTAVFRFMSNGILDPGFSNDGIAVVDILPDSTFFLETANAVLIDNTTGGIMVGGWAYDTTNIGFTLYRLLDNGTLDPAFGNAGISRTFGNEIFDLVQQPDGKIIAAGYAGDNLFENDIVVKRYLPNGDPDPSFGMNGTVITDFGYVEANGVALQPDGKIVIAGFYYQCTLFFCDYNFIIGRYNQDGTVDYTFRTSGFFTASIGLDEELHKVLIQPNGDIVAVGYYENAMEEDDLVLIRLTDSLPPTAQLTADPLSGCWPLTIHYFDKSIGNPASWQWSFPGGVPATSTERNPTVVYNQPGTYSATLTVSNSLGNSTITSTDIITVNAPPTADFTYTTNGNDVAFLNTTSGVTTANWNFGDGTTSTSNSPGHTYATSGTFTVTLTATNACGSNAITENVVVTGNTVTGVRYVDHAATGANNGTNWANAYNNLQDAIDAAPPGYQIWVAKGVYKPTQQFSGDTSDRYKTFYISKNIAIYGGFDGTETLLEQRDNQSNQTVLSGDLDNNDLDPDGNGITELTNQIKGSNAYHVLWIENTDHTMRLDGFFVCGGRSDGNIFDESENGSGLYLDGKNAQSATSPSIANCTFTGNYAETDGGGVYLKTHAGGSASPAFFNCTFQNNRASGGAGVGIYSNFDGSTTNPEFLQCSFLHNSANFGGALSNKGFPTGNSSINPSLINCLFDDNHAGFGGAVYSNKGNPNWVNCSFLQNGGTFGGAVMIEHGSPMWTNCTFSKNDANWGGAIRSSGDSLTLNNCIIWGNTGDLENNINNENADAVVYLRHTLIQEANCPPGFTCDNGVIFNQNPLFVNANTGNLRLQAASPAIDHGDNNAVPAGITADLDGNTRIDNTTVDMGAYEFGATVGLDNQSGLPDIRLFPNPANGSFVVEMQGDAIDEVVCSLIAPEGRVLRREIVHLLAGTFTQRYETGDMPGGLYLVRIQAGSLVMFRKVVIEH